jgi:hypothetical protein
MRAETMSRIAAWLNVIILFIAAAGIVWFAVMGVQWMRGIEWLK